MIKSLSARVSGFVKRFSVAQQFAIASLIALLTGMVLVGWWVGEQITAGVVNRTAATTALYVDSVITPNLEDLRRGGNQITPEYAAKMHTLLEGTALGQQIVSLKVWSPQGRILYSANPAVVGKSFPVEGNLARAVEGTVAATLDDLADEENIAERQRFMRLLEIYSPVRLHGTGAVGAVIEFYQQVDDLEQEILAAKRQSWLVVGVATLLMYGLLAGFVQRASNTIVRQQDVLYTQVAQLQELLGQNEELHERVRRAAARSTAFNERNLRRISAELHDGPAQDLGFALLRLDHVVACCTKPQRSSSNGDDCVDDLNAIENSLRRALHEIRAISSGLGLPQLHELTLGETIGRVVRTHERRTGTKVKLELEQLPAQASLPVKITVYRLVQEALNNAYRHAGGAEQEVKADNQGSMLHVEVTDHGPGFDVRSATHGDHLGLVGMRERVESLGGLFQVESTPSCGTRVDARLSVQAGEDSI